MRIWILCIIATCYYVDKAKSDLGFGGCGSIQSVDPFNVTGIFGTWYVYEVNEIISVITTRCSVIDIERANNNGQTITLQVSRSVLNTNINFPTQYTATQIGNSSKFNQIGLFFMSSPLYIIATDYNSYMIMYICTDVFGLAHDRNVIIATRNRHPSNATINAVEALVVKQNLGNPNNFFPIRQDNCDHK
ncbi:hypothetical protein QE152_g26899 [Popillia japonica]|uniref:Lipocalin/cytosolic fatty-acid binding domain-containing protein n=1 Tax=Popillia japonica TaxID=7064 RepID=A0AAW1JWY9_POPJA